MPKAKSVLDPEANARFVARLREVAAEHGSASRLARTAGVSDGALRKWLRGSSEPTRERLVALARAAGVSVAWLAAGEGPRSPGPTGLTDDPAAGPLVEWHGDPYRGEVLFTQRWLDAHGGPGALAVARMPDDSMAPLLPAGATLVYARGEPEPSRDGVYALTLEGTLLVRRLQRLPGGSIESTAENPRYHAFRFQQNDPSVAVLGPVVWVGHDL